VTRTIGNGAAGASRPAVVAGPSSQGVTVFVTQVGGARGARAAAAALACAVSEPDRAALLVDLDGGGRVPRPSLIATAGARALEERLAVHLPESAIASRGQICLLKLPPDPAAIDQVVAALPLVREAAGVVHVPPPLLRPLLDETRISPTAALLRADLVADRALTALAARDLIARGLRVVVLKRPLGWLAARAALFGGLPEGGEALPARMRRRLLEVDSPDPPNLVGQAGRSTESPRARCRRP